MADLEFPAPGDIGWASIGGTSGADLNVMLNALKGVPDDLADHETRIDALEGSPGPESGYDVKDYGAVGNGTTSDYAAFQAAIDAANAAGGGVVSVPPGTYKLDGAVALKSNVTLQGAGPGISVLNQAYWPNPSRYGQDTLSLGTSATTANAAIQTSGTIGSTVSCGAVVVGDIVITSTTTTGLAADDLITLTSSDTTLGSHRRGETLRVKHLGTFNSGTGAWDNTTTTFTIYGGSRDAYSTSPVWQKLTPVVNVAVLDLSIVNTAPGTDRDDYTSDANAYGSAGTGSYASVQLGFKYCRNVLVRNVSLEKSDQAGLRLTTVFGSKVTGCTFKDLTDNSPNYQWGYGVLVESACDSTLIENNNFLKCRHSMTTGGVGSANYYGGPHGVVFIGNNVSGTTDAGVDSHEDGRDVLIANNIITAVQSSAISVRSAGTRVFDNSISYCDNGIAVHGPSGGDAQGLAHKTIVRGNSIHRITGNFGIMVSDADQCVVIGNVIDGTAGPGVFITNDAASVAVIDNYIRNFSTFAGGSRRAGVYFEPNSGGYANAGSSGHRIENNFFENFASTPESGDAAGNGQWAIRNDSAAVTGSYFVGNRCTGLPSTNFINDSASNVQIANMRYDTIYRGYVTSVPSASKSTMQTFRGFVEGEANPTFEVYGDGVIWLGAGGASAVDVNLSRPTAGVLATNSHLRFATLGKKVYIKEGTNGAQGVATLVAGTVTVSTTAVTSTCRIHLTVQSLGTVTTPKSIAVTTKTAGTSFVITSEDNTDTSVVAWVILDSL